MSTLLIVEDNEMNRDMLTRRLARRGYGIAHAENGQEAVDYVKGQSVDLILMDVSLPVLDGLQATRLIKADPGTSGIPIIVITANATTEDRTKAFEAGCDDYQTKPVDLDELLAKLSKYLPSEPGKAANA